MRTFGLMLVLLCSSLCFAVTPEDEIRAVLDQQVAAWNRGDLEGYMAGYWNSPDLVFYSGATITRGWDTTLKRYRQSYKARGKQMGKLGFSDVQIQFLASDAAFVRGHWRLRMRRGKGSRGLSTLIFKKLPEGWRIVHDHSSVEL